MAKVQAVHTIQRAKSAGKPAQNGQPAQRPEIETIKPGTIFESSGEELADLEKMGAVRKPDERPASLPADETGDAYGGEGEVDNAGRGRGRPRGSKKGATVETPAARRARTAGSTKAVPATAGAAAKAKEEGKPDGTEAKDGEDLV